jgi:hypothetical protein
MDLHRYGTLRNDRSRRTHPRRQVADTQEELIVSVSRVSWESWIRCVPPMRVRAVFFSWVNKQTRAAASDQAAGAPAS